MAALKLRILIALALVCALISIPSIAAAESGTGTVVSTRTETVSGVEVAGEIIKNLGRVDIGSDGATVTVDVDGAPHAIGLGLADVQPGIGAGKSMGFAGLAMIGAAAAGVFKIAAVVVRLLG